MPTCFVIQPFDAGGKFDKRFNDTYKQAIEDAGLEPYRVDQDPGVEVPIDTIEKGIREATICLADITTDNPNVWYELGYAFAMDRSVIMVCGEERVGRLPFDIQHRTVIKYTSESKGDFDSLGQKIAERARKLLEKNEVRQVRQMIEADGLAPQEGLSSIELSVLALAAAGTGIPSSSVSAHNLQRDAERSGLTPIGFGLGLRELKRKGLVELEEAEDGEGYLYQVVALSDDGWSWIARNESLFSLRKEEDKTSISDDDIPF